MLIGVDFDNTIVCYDRLFHRLALERDWIPAGLEADKSSVRDYLRGVDREDDWTLLQGIAYGSRIDEAAAFPGVKEFFAECREGEVPVCIVSHKTRHPYRGPKLDLHGAARSWLGAHGFVGDTAIGLPEDRVFLEETKQAKLERIAKAGCTHFIDDLPEFLLEEDFPTDVCRILFDPAGQYSPPDDILHFTSWQDLRRYFFPTQAERELGEWLSEKAGKLLEATGVACCGEPTITQLSGGGNNGVFRVRQGGESYILKKYFRHPNDPRDRYGTETSFSSFLWHNGIRVIPEVLATLPKARLALYRHIEGRRLKASEVDTSHVDQAVDFCHDLFRLRELPEAQELPVASEACFSVTDHLACVHRRVARLTGDPSALAGYAGGHRFAHDELLPCWNKVFAGVEARMATNPNLDRVLTAEERVLSPSDFGFHNALLTGSGCLCFFDFEYAGWDDPAKLVCDFFCQVAIPAPRSLMPHFIESLPRTGGVVDSLAARVECLFPVYLVKWCTIVLNEFALVEAAERRMNAGGPPPAEHFDIQLEKARQLLQDAERYS